MPFLKIEVICLIENVFELLSFQMMFSFREIFDLKIRTSDNIILVYLLIFGTYQIIAHIFGNLPGYLKKWLGK